MSTLHYKNGTLHMEDVALDALAATHGTPIYCYSTEQIADNFHALQNALKTVMPESGFTICYACKANSNQAVIQLLRRLGAGADVVSGGEMYRAFKAGIKAKHMVFSGVGKTDAELTKAIKNGILKINVESEAELLNISRIAQREAKEAHVAIRINPNVDAETHAKITTGLDENKFGIDIGDAPALFDRAAKLAGVKATGVAVHIGSQITTLAPYREAFRATAALVEQLRAQGRTISTIDIGGGIGITYKDETPLDLAGYAGLIRDILLPLGAHIILEPGRFLVGNAGVLVTKVIYTKKTARKNFLIVDAAMNDLIRPALYEAYHPVLPVKENMAAQAVSYDVVGPVCETGDTFLTDEKMHEMQTDDLAAITVAGAYGAVMASTYNTRPLVPEVLVSGKQFDLIRKPQKIEDLVAGDIVPPWLL